MKTKFTLFVLLTFALLILSNNESTAQWVQQNSGTTYNLESVFFINDNTGYCTGTNPNTYVGTIYKTTNGGSTWDSLDVHPPAPYPVFFIEENTGWVGCYDMVLKTIDAGSTWIEQQLGLGIVIFSIYFPDVNTGYLAGNDFTNEVVVILKTTNGGGSWTDITPTSLDNENVRCIRCTDINTCYMGFSGGDITIFMMKTTDGGSSWNDITPPMAGEVWSICFVDEDTGYTTGQNDGYCQIMKTMNAGIDWVEVLPTGLYQRGLSICFPDANTGCVVTEEGDILKTTSAGNTWALETSGVTTELNSVYFPSNDVGYIVGDNGVILKFDESIGIDYPLFSQKNKVIIYPNPFETKAVLKINDDIKIVSAELRMYDSYGREVCKITNIRSNEVEINKKGLNSGLYFYSLSENQSIISAGKILIK